MDHKINHLAIIMDGNSRWAKKNNKTTAQGHKQGAEAAKNLLPHITKLNIKYVTLYAFSSENWQRPEGEVSFLLDLLSAHVLSQIEKLNEHNIKLKIIGDFKNISKNLKEKIQNAIAQTENNSGTTLCIAFSYGGRQEIVAALNKAFQEEQLIDSEDEFAKYLYDPEMPDVDLLIRTGGVYRISNFLLWQLAYAELYFTDTYWPDFDHKQLNIAIEDYMQRSRTFGKRIN